MGVWSSDAYEGPNRPLESRRGKRTSWSEDLDDAINVLKGLHDMGASAARGGVKATLGAPGDIEELIRKMSGGAVKDDTVFPTTTNMGQLLPPVREGQKESPYEGVGEVLNPITPAKKAIVAGAGLEHLLPLAQAAGTATPAALKASLYAGALRKDLLASHGTHAKSLLKNNELPKELYNLSMGIDSNSPAHFNSPNVHLIPHEGKFDPKDSPTSLAAFDSYSPRWTDAQGKRRDELIALVRELRTAKDDVKATSSLDPDEFQRVVAGDDLGTAISTLKEHANKRLVDRLYSTWPKGGVRQEGTFVSTDGGELIKPGPPALPRYMKGGYEKEYGEDASRLFTAPKLPPTPRDLAYGKQFQSFRDYEKDPTGAARLHAGDESWIAEEKMQLALGQHGEKIAKLTGHDFDTADRLFDESDVPEILRTLAGAKKGSPQYDPQLQKIAAAHLQALRRTKSDYAELKAWGPVGLHSDNFAGLIADPWHMTKDERQALQQSAKERGLAYAEVNGFDPTNKFTSKKLFDIAKDMQHGKPMEAVSNKTVSLPAQQAYDAQVASLSPTIDFAAGKTPSPEAIQKILKGLQPGDKIGPNLKANPDFMKAYDAHVFDLSKLTPAEQHALTPGAAVKEAADHIGVSHFKLSSMLEKQSKGLQLTKEEYDLNDMYKDYIADYGPAVQPTGPKPKKAAPGTVGLKKAIAAADAIKAAKQGGTLTEQSAEALGVHPLTLDAAVMADKKGESLTFSQKALVKKHNEFINTKNADMDDALTLSHNVAKMTNGKKTSIKELTQEELDHFLDEGLDEGIHPDKWH